MVEDQEATVDAAGQGPGMPVPACFLPLHAGPEDGARVGWGFPPQFSLQRLHRQVRGCVSEAILEP